MGEELNMDNLYSLRLIQLHERLSEIASHLTRLHFSQSHFRQIWSPAINAYRCDEGIVICVDLAGVDKTRIEVSLQARSLLIRGTRQPPEPGRESGSRLQILAMEIDCGPFEREVPLPLEVDPEGVRAEQRNGLLWVYLPLHPEA
jgi:HSP20 family protein